MEIGSLVRDRRTGQYLRIVDLPVFGATVPQDCVRVVPRAQDEPFYLPLDYLERVADAADPRRRTRAELWLIVIAELLVFLFCGWAGTYLLDHGIPFWIAVGYSVGSAVLVSQTLRRVFGIRRR